MGVSRLHSHAGWPGRIFRKCTRKLRRLKSVKIAAIHSNSTTLTLTLNLNPKLKITPILTLTLNRCIFLVHFLYTQPATSLFSMSTAQAFGFKPYILETGYLLTLNFVNSSTLVLSVINMSNNMSSYVVYAVNDFWRPATMLMQKALNSSYASFMCHLCLIMSFLH